jgi:hypothetical protein
MKGKEVRFWPGVGETQYPGSQSFAHPAGQGNNPPGTGFGFRTTDENFAFRDGFAAPSCADV